MGLGFGSIILLMIIGGIIAVTTASTLSDLTSKLYRHPQAASTSIRYIKTDLVAIHRSMKDVAMSSSIEQMKEAQNKVDQYAKNSEASFAILDDRFLGDKTDMGFKTNLNMIPEESVAIVVLCDIYPAPVKEMTVAASDTIYYSRCP